MLDFRIETFLTVCDTLNFTKAAEILHITQPAVSQHIKYLEKKYNTKLFYYEGKKVLLTPAGELLRNTATTMHNDEKLMIDRIRSASISQIPFHFGVTMTIGEYVIARPLARFLRENAYSNIYVEMANTDQLIAKLNEGIINFAIVEGYFDRKKYDSAIMANARFIPVCSSSHVFEKEPKVLKDLLNESLILRERGSGTRNILEKQLDAQNLSVEDFHDIIHINALPAIVQLVEEGMGITFIFYDAAKEGIEKGTLREIELEDFNVFHEFAFIWQSGSVNSDYYRSLCANFQSCL